MTRLSAGVSAAGDSVGVGEGSGADVGATVGIGVGCRGVEAGSGVDVDDGVEAGSVEHANKAKPIKYASRKACLGIGLIVLIPGRPRSLAVC